MPQETLLNSAAALLAVCAGTAAAGIITRTFIFETEAKDDNPALPLFSFSIYLTDVPLDNHDYGSVGAQTWGGACILAEMIVEAPTAFGIPEIITSMPLRCLELGAGTGLVSLTVGKIIQSKLATVTPKLLGELGRLEVVATDYYPSVLANLDTNIKANFSSSTSNAICIESQALDWSQFSSPEYLSQAISLQLPFDVVYGADIIYEDQHAEWIKLCLWKLLKKPTHMQREPTFHLIIPLRQTHQAESNTIERVFCREKSEPDIRRPKHDGGELIIKHRETILCDAETGNDNERVEYLYYRIGWDI
ncbi:hypothetical protein CPB83DRAFT_855318 [Crepidotus variabilis]|uniref:Uncharacterized protein n=1 Tax=Crepidotus variabilis TaxID=179855 RepID=A0A9P6EF75_9AGAR|nr:hypothetical protein CPB83DRAFT_855318 [Crepidotus variabilis]